MAKTRPQTATDTQSRNDTNNLEDHVRKPMLRRCRPGRRERQLLRNPKTAEKRASIVPEEAPVEMDVKSLFAEHSEYHSPLQTAWRQRRASGKKRRSRGIPNRPYYMNNRPDSLDVRFGSLSTHLSTVLKCSANNAKAALEVFIEKRRDTFRDYLKHYIEHRQWDEAHARQRREEDVNLLKDFIEKTVTASFVKEKDVLWEAYEKHDRDMKWLEDDLFDELRSRQDGHAEGVQGALDGFEQGLNTMKERMKDMEQKMDGVLRASGDQQRWGIRAPAPLVDDSD